MDNFIEFISSNLEWIFSGIGVSILGLLINVFRKRRSNKRIQIKTSGKQSPGIVKGDYNVNSYEKD